MAEVLLFHHVQGLAEGVEALADDLRAGGHTVHAPSFFEGRTFGTLEEGFAYLRDLPEGEVARRVDEVVAPLPAALVYAGVSWGVVRAQGLAQTRPGARGALLLESCLPLGDDGFGPWPDGVPVQVHGAEGDEWFAEDLPAARDLVASVGPELAELHTYPGGAHLFTDRSLPSYDAGSARLVVERALALLDRVG